MAALRLCSIPDCDKPHLARGWCRRHYKRWQAHGDPIGGRQANGQAERYFNEVVVTFTGNDCLVWPYTRNRQGYGMWNKAIVSRLACEQIHGPPPTPDYEAAHLCGKGHEGCVNPVHLTWKTHAENLADRTIHGTMKAGWNISPPRLTPKDVAEIKRIGSSMKQSDLGRLYGVSGPTISGILTGKRYRHLLPNPPDDFQD